MFKQFVLIPFLTAGFVLPVAAAACPDDQLIAATAEAFLTKAPGPGYPESLTLEDAYCGQAKFVALIGEQLGERAGYKAGQTSKRLQEVFGADEPVGGVMFKSMLLPSGTEIEANYGVRTAYEADLIVTVIDERINAARTHDEVVQYLGEVIPFIELLDVVLAEGEAMTRPAIVGYNVMSRFGVVGAGIPVEPTPEFIDALANLEAVMTDDTGAEIERAMGSAIMEHPLNVVLWLIQHVNAQGQQLRPGDILSLGTMGSPRPVEAGRTITVRYTGLPNGESETAVTFR